MIPLFCKTSISSPETLTLNLHGSPFLSSPCSSSGSCLSSSLRTRIQKSPSMLRNFKQEDSCVVDSESSSATPLRMKRPARIDIPVTPLSFVATEMTLVVAELEVERENFSVYCKKGRRETMEDRYSVVVDLQGDPKQLYPYQRVINDDYNIVNTLAGHDLQTSTSTGPQIEVGDDDDDEWPLNENDDNDLDDVDEGEERNTQHLVLA